LFERAGVRRPRALPHKKRTATRSESGNVSRKKILATYVRSGGKVANLPAKSRPNSPPLIKGPRFYEAA
jgi:hypothetical protein